MIIWTDEQLRGDAPIYNILGSADISGVHFKTANEILRPGTEFSEKNMDAIVQKPQTGRYFYYGGEDTVTTDFPAAEDGLSRGIFLAQAHAGMELAAEGTVYIVAGGSAQKIENPRGLYVARDCAVYCRAGEETKGVIMWRLKE
ncbi:MAG: hypothetical protein LBE55_04070 [Clostridiales bacterium]|jgi:hypothetical protein|nr:hypothetical protein [Clostridiales bacterium]